MAEEIHEIVTENLSGTSGATSPVRGGEAVGEGTALATEAGAESVQSRYAPDTIAPETGATKQTAPSPKGEGNTSSVTAVAATPSPEGEDKTGDAQARLKAMSNTLGRALMKAALQTEGVSAERMSRAMKLMDVDGIDPTAEDAETKYTEAAKALIQEIPEIKGAQAVNTGSSGEHGRRGESANDKALAAFRAGMNM